MRVFIVQAATICLTLLPGTAHAQSSALAPDRVAYTAAIVQKNPERRIKSLQLFLKQFPDTTMKEGALEGLVGAYVQTGNSSLVSETLEQLLKTNPDNLYGATLEAKLPALCDGPPGFCEEKAASITNHGLRLLASPRRPDYLTEAEFEKQMSDASTSIHRLAGVIALNHHDCHAAQLHLANVVASNPSEFGSVYPLALAYIKSDPPDLTKGLFYLARAASLAPIATNKQIVAYGKSEYEKYQGSAKDWQKLLKWAKTHTEIPPWFAVTPAEAP